ncbi:MAG TPA: hypothetical protein VIV15_17775, partial [Anaerolineales bacterium]
VDNKDGKVDLNDPDHKQMFVTVKSLPAGVYQVIWHTVTTDDNGVSDGMWYFGVGQVAVPTYVPPAEPTGTAATPAATTAASTPAVAPSVAPSSPTAATPAVAPIPAVPTAQTSSGSSIVIAAGVVQALVVIGLLVYLFRKNP